MISSPFWTKMDEGPWNEEEPPTTKYLKRCRRNSLQVVKLDSTRHEEEAQELRKQCCKLVQELPKTSLVKRDCRLTKNLPEEVQWKAVSKLTAESLGEVVLLQSQTATWKLKSAAPCVSEVQQANRGQRAALPREVRATCTGHMHESMHWSHA